MSGVWCASLMAAVHTGASAPGPVNLAFGGRCSLLELVAALEDVMGRTLSVRHGPARSGDVRDSQADQTRLRAMFPHIEPVSLEEGLRATVAWSRQSVPSVSTPPTTRGAAS